MCSDELYEILSSLPESVVYSCWPCSVTQPSAWRELLYIELRAGVEKGLACLLSSTLTQHLVTCSQVGHSAGLLRRPCAAFVSNTFNWVQALECFFPLKKLISFLSEYWFFKCALLSAAVWEVGWSWQSNRRTTSLWPPSRRKEVWQRPLYHIGEYTASRSMFKYLIAFFNGALWILPYRF